MRGDNRTFRYLQRKAGEDRPDDEVLEAAYSADELRGRAVIRDTLLREYRVFDDWGAFWDWRATRPAPHCYDEVVIGSHPQRLKFDVDMPSARLASVVALRDPEIVAESDQDVEALLCDLGFAQSVEKSDSGRDAAAETARHASRVVEDLIEAVLDELAASYGACDGVAPAREDLVVTESSGPSDDGGWKYSFHVIVLPYAVADHSEAKDFTERVVDAMPPGSARFVDRGVNKSLQNFRLAGSEKPRTGRVKEICARFGTALPPMEATTIAPPPEARLLTRMRDPPAANAEPRPDLGEDDRSRVEAVLAAAGVTEGHSLRAVRGTLFAFDRRWPTHCRICDEVHHKDNTLVICANPIERRPEAGRTARVLHELVETCRHAPGQSRRVAEIDLAPTDVDAWVEARRETPGGARRARDAADLKSAPLNWGAAQANYADSAAGFLEELAAEQIAQEATAGAPSAGVPPAGAPRVDVGRSEVAVDGAPPARPARPRGLAEWVAAFEAGTEDPHKALATRFERLPDTHVYSEPRMRDYELVPTLAVKAQMKLGKTRALREYVATHFPAGGLRPRVVRIVTFRRTFSHSIRREHFADFALYSEHTGPLDPGRFPRLIVQVESLHRLPMPAAPEPVDLLVLDEVESVLGQFDSGLHRSFAAAFAMFEWMVRTARHVVCLDANIGDRTLRLLEVLRGDRPPLFHWNQHQAAAGDVYRFTGDQAAWLDALYSALRAGQRLVVPTNSLAEAAALEAEVRRRFPDKAVALYSSRTPPGEKAKHFADVHAYWGALDVLIYTPTVSAGVSFELPRFDALYGYFTDASCDVETCRQMLGRVRQLATREHVICLVGRGNNLPVAVADIRRLLRDKRAGLYRELGDAGLGFTYGARGEVVFLESPYFHLWLETERVRNLSRNDFAGRFVAQVADTGATVGLLPPPDGPEAVDRLLAVRAAQANARREVRAAEDNAVATAADLAPEEAAEVRRQLDRQDEVAPALYRAYQKHQLRDTYGWHGRPLDAEFVEKYAPREARAVYRNLQRITVGETVVDSLRAIQRHEQTRHRSLLEAGLGGAGPLGGGADPLGAVSAVGVHGGIAGPGRQVPTEGGLSALESRDLHYRYVFQAHFLAIWLLRICGFRCLTDPAWIRIETVYQSLKARQSDFLGQLEAINFEFGIRRPSVQWVASEQDPAAYVARVLQVINRVLGKMYGIAIRRTRKKNGAQDYRIQRGPTFRLFAFSDVPLPDDHPGGAKPHISSRLRALDDGAAENFLDSEYYDRLVPDGVVGGDPEAAPAWAAPPDLSAFMCEIAGGASRAYRVAASEAAADAALRAYDEGEEANAADADDPRDPGPDVEVSGAAGAGFAGADAVADADFDALMLELGE